MEFIKTLIQWLQSFFTTELFTLGQTPVTVWTIVHIVLLVILLYVFSDKLRSWVTEKYLVKRGVDVGVRQAIGNLTRYLVLVLGFLAIIQSSGIDLSSMILVGGAVGIGVGLGLQQTANDFFSGMVLLIERPIKVGDRVEVAHMVGDVVKIGLRATTIITNDNIAIIVPNSQFTSNLVTNWTYSDRDIRFHLTIGVSYNSDPEQVAALLLEVASEEEGVLKSPKPDVIFLGFGDSALNFELRVWTDMYITQPSIFRSILYFAIWKKFKSHGIEIPYPQRDIHIRSGRDNVQPS